MEVTLAAKPNRPRTLISEVVCRHLVRLGFIGLQRWDGAAMTNPEEKYYSSHG